MCFSKTTTLFFAVCFSLFSANTVLSADSQFIIPDGDVGFHEESKSLIEDFTFPQELVTALHDVAKGESITIAEFPVEPGVRQLVTLKRVEVYADSARVIVVDEHGERDAPRSNRAYFRGTSVWNPDIGIALSVDPATGNTRGIVRNRGSVFTIAEPASANAPFNRFGTPEALRPAGSPPLEHRCGSDKIPAELLFDSEPAAPFGSSEAGKGIATDPLYSAVMAFDTDQEWLHYRFADNQTNATNWIADYINESNVMYERDLSMTLLIGTTYLRTGGPPFDSDPYSVVESPAFVGMLNEFGNFWAANYGDVDRVFAQLLSGKSSSNYSSSGIAWLDGYCEQQSSGGGYSIFEPFKASGVPMASNVSVGAHEFGHNFGSPHTHCYSPVIDECYNQEGGCFSGTPTSCPATGQGTMMSYCHFNSCGDNQIQFHSRVVTLIDGYRAAHTPSCIQEIADPTLIFEDGFEDGDLSAWIPWQ